MHILRSHIVSWNLLPITFKLHNDAVAVSVMDCLFSPFLLEPVVEVLRVVGKVKIDDPSILRAAAKCKL